jgi:hypothetical protein
MEERTLSPIATLTKLDVAKSQLDTAIELWFEDRDPASIHTLSCAAHEIIEELFKRKGLTGLLFENSLPKQLRRQIREEHKMIAGFFKHADRNPNETLTFNTELSEGILMFSLVGLQMLGEPMSVSGNIFRAWMQLTHPELFPVDVSGQSVPINIRELVGTLTKQEFFKAVQLLYR